MFIHYFISFRFRFPIQECGEVFFKLRIELMCNKNVPQNASKEIKFQIKINKA